MKTSRLLNRESLLYPTRQKKAKPVKIKLRRSLPGVLNESKQLHSTGSRSTFLRTLTLDRKVEESFELSLLNDARKRSTPDSHEQQFDGFPSLPKEVVKNIVDFSIPQEMIDESNSRRKEAEDESLAFLFEAVRMLRDKDPSTFIEKFAALNHLFEKSPLKNRSTSSTKKFINENNSTNKKSDSSVVDAVVARIVEENDPLFDISTDPKSSPISNPFEDHPGSLEKRCRGRPRGSFKMNKAAHLMSRTRGRPRGSTKHSSFPTSLNLRQLDEKEGEAPDTRLLEEPLNTSTDTEESLKSQRPSRKRVSSGFYRALNSMALSNGYQLASQKSKGFSLLS